MTTRSGLFYGANFKERVMVINQLGVSPNVMRLPSPKGGPGPGAQDKGPDFSVNGRAQPMIDMPPGEVQMWRIANTSGRSGAFFNPFPTGFIGCRSRRTASSSTTTPRSRSNERRS